ncbi:alpha/beta hydrolase [Streptomyces olivaceiscleroticus]|uniref:AB hydrolase-1 domain-containing protein n=1 Tax=Streptomyces olivaceiscleroticus TaxID=68245 RepID=A0ABP3JG06_9ACTN
MELRELLRAQNIPAPYVLVPHSLGGMYAHRFAQLYPQDVAGLVWLDAFHRDWDDPAHIRQALIDAKVSDEWTHAGVAERTNLAELAAELQAGPNIA